MKLIYNTYSFDMKDDMNYSNFNKSITGTPLITPKKTVYLVGQNNMFLSEMDEINAKLSRDIENAITFVAGKTT